MIKIFNPNDRDFSSNGNICINPISCIEKKKKSLNGWYLEVKVDIKYKEYIKKDYLVVIKTKSSLNPQAFRIADDDNDSTIQYTDRFIIFKANHVAFDSKRYFLVDVRPTKLNAITALEYINERTDQESPFFVYSDIDSISTSYFIRKNLLEAWEIFEERYSGYFLLDNWNVRLMSSIGKETGEIIAYGQKLQGFQIFESWSNVVTKLCPVGSNGLMLDEVFIESDIQYDVPYTKTQQFTSDLPIEEQTEENLKKELKIKAENHLNENKYPLVSYEITSDINQDLDIGDKAHIKHPLADIKVEVVEYTYDHVQEKIVSIVFGNFVRDVKSKFDTIKQNIIDQSEKLSAQEKTILHQTELINNLNKNGLVYIDDNEVLILDKIPKEQAKNVWRWGLGGLAFSNKGYEGPFSTAITQDGQINADFITTGKINTNLIEGYEQLVQKVSRTEESIENIKTTTQLSTGGNHLCIDGSLGADVLEYTIHGKSEQKVVKKSEDPNLFNLDSWKNIVNSIDIITKEPEGNIAFDNETLIMSNPTSTRQITSSFFDGQDPGTEEQQKLILNIGIEVSNTNDDYILAFDTLEPEYDIGMVYFYNKDWVLLTEYGGVTEYVNGRVIFKFKPHIDTKYMSIAFNNYRYDFIDDTTLVVKNISVRKNHSEYIPYENIDEMPSITNPSEIKTISSIRNLLETDLLKFASKGLNLEFERSTVKIDGTSTNQGTQTIKTKTNLKKGIYTISFWKLGGTLERKDSNDCQLFVQTSDGTTERLTNITGSRLENNENAKTTINLEEDKEIFLYFYYKGDLVFNNYEIGIQIEEGSIMHDYRPSGAYAKVRITGNNQFNLKTASRMSYSYGLPNKQTNAIEIEDYDSNNLSFSMTANGYGYALSNIHYLKPNTEYILSYNRKNANYPGSSNTRYYIYTIDENGDYVDNQHSADTDGDKQYLFTTSETGMVAFAWGTDNKSSGASSVISNIMIVEKTEETGNIEYAPSKENEVLIDLNKSNLFGGDIELGTLNNTTGESVNGTQSVRSVDFMEVKSNNSYTIKNNNNYANYVYEYDSNKSFIKYYNATETPFSFITDSNTKYIKFRTVASRNENDLTTKFDIFEGYEDYYELCTNDTLNVEGDNVELHKEIGKIVLDGSQSISGYSENTETGYFCVNYFDSSIKKVVYNEKGVISDRLLGTTIAETWSKTKEGISLGNNGQYIQFSFKYDLLPSRNVDGVTAYLKDNPITAYYLLAEPQDILLPKTSIPLFDGINHIQFMDDMQTTTSVYFLKETLISGEYVVQPQLNQTNKNLSTTDEKANKNASDINATNTNLNNNYYNKDQIDVMNTSTEQIITQIRNQVEMTTNATNLQISVLEEKIVNGVTSVTTETGYKFDREGLSISKTGEPMKSILDNDGLRVYRDSTVMLRANSNEVYTQNLIVNTYLIQRPIRREQGTSISDGSSIGIVEYWIGTGGAS